MSGRTAARRCAMMPDVSIFEQLADHAELPFERGRMLPVEAYTSPGLLAAEVAELFGSDWLCVGRTADLAAPGDHLLAELPVATRPEATRSALVVRGDDDTVRAFDNVCVHRGAQLVSECGNASRLTCPYHAWTYRLDGSLVGAPFMDRTPGFDPADRRLSELPCEIWEGFVFVNQDPNAQSLAPRLDGLTEVVGRYDMASYVPIHEATEIWDTNWKLLVENFLDAYHVFKVHKDSFGADGDSTLNTMLHPGTDQWTHHRVIEPGPELAAASKTGLQGDWRRTIVLAAVFPGFVMQLQPDWLWFLRISPAGTDRVRIAWQVAVAPETLAEADDAERLTSDLLELIDQVNSEDRPIVEGVRASVDRPQFERAPMSWLERNVFDFDRYLATRLGRR